MTSAPNRIRLMQQGRPDFSVGPKLQTIWGLRESSVFSIEGLASTVMILSAAVRWLPGMIGAEIAMIIAVALLFSHLGNPWVAWRAIANFRRSWISRGTAVIGAFVGLGVVAIAFATFIPAPPIVAETVIWLQILSAAFILMYPGFAMSASAGIPFWNTGLLPILSGLGGLSVGAAACIALNSLAPLLLVSARTAIIGEIILLALVGMCIAALVSASSRMGAGARLSGRRMMCNELLWFWGGAILVGLAAPALLLALVLQSSLTELPVQIALFAAALLRILGDIAFRYAVMKVGVYESLM